MPPLSPGLLTDDAEDLATGKALLSESVTLSAGEVHELTRRVVITTRPSTDPNEHRVVHYDVFTTEADL
jgi:hypothetical protein